MLADKVIITLVGDSDTDEWGGVLDANVKGVFLRSKHGMKAMRKTRKFNTSKAAEGGTCRSLSTSH